MLCTKVACVIFCVIPLPNPSEALKNKWEAGTTHVSQIGLFARIFEGGQVRGELRHEHRSASGDRPRELGEFAQSHGCNNSPKHTCRIQKGQPQKAQVIFQFFTFAFCFLIQKDMRQNSFEILRAMWSPPLLSSCSMGCLRAVMSLKVSRNRTTRSRSFLMGAICSSSHSGVSAITLHLATSTATSRAHSQVSSLEMHLLSVSVFVCFGGTSGALVTWDKMCKLLWKCKFCWL